MSSLIRTYLNDYPSAIIPYAILSMNFLLILPINIAKLPLNSISGCKTKKKKLITKYTLKKNLKIFRLKFRAAKVETLFYFSKQI
jgi:hypothetical protein